MLIANSYIMRRFRLSVTVASAARPLGFVAQPAQLRARPATSRPTRTRAGAAGRVLLGMLMGLTLNLMPRCGAELARDRVRKSPTWRRDPLHPSLSPSAW